MPEIERIVIKGASGYCCIDEAFNDKITITPESIAYEYIPGIESEMNPKRKWSYITNSPLFKIKYGEIVSMLPEIIEKGIDVFCIDIGGIEFKEIYWVPGDYFEELFKIIKSMVPECEYTPAVLLTSEDYEEEEDD